MINLLFNTIRINRHRYKDWESNFGEISTEYRFSDGEATEFVFARAGAVELSLFNRRAIQTYTSMNRSVQAKTVIHNYTGMYTRTGGPNNQRKEAFADALEPRDNCELKNCDGARDLYMTRAECL
uniref:Uncharacterized protein n=1 Tax=Trichogramma kaykai TaxID=54128 RepID=A0ABD2W445_9HYME